MKLLYHPYHFSFALFLFFCISKTKAQQTINVQDQIATLLENTEITAKISAEEAKEVAQKAQEIAKNNRSKKNLGTALLLEGIAAYYSGELVKANKNLNKAIKQFQAAQDSLGMARVLFQQGMIEYDFGSFDQSLDKFLSALKIQQSLKLSVPIANSYTQIGWINFLQANLDKAFEYYQKAHEIYKKEQKLSLVARSFSNLAIIFDERDNDLDKALEYQMKGLKILEEIDDQGGLGKLYNNLGILHKNRKEYDISREYYLKGIALYQEIKNPSREAVTYYNLGMLDFNIKDYQAAISNYQKALNMFLDMQLKDQIRKCYKKLSQVYEVTGHYQKSLKYSHLQANTRAQIYDEKKAQQIANLQEQYESEQKEKQIQALSHEKALATSRNRLYLALFILAIVAGGGIFWIQRIRHFKNLEIAEAELQNEQLKQEKLNLELESSNKTLAAQALQMIQKNNLMQEMQAAAREVLKTEEIANKSAVKKLINLVDYSFNLDKEWEDFKNSFENTHPDFFSNLKTEFIDITSNELKLCALIKLNLNLKESATILGISPDSVKTARYRLRKKLNLPKEEKLADFLIRY